MLTRHPEQREDLLDCGEFHTQEILALLGMTFWIDTEELVMK